MADSGSRMRLPLGVLILFFSVAVAAQDLCEGGGGFGLELASAAARDAGLNPEGAFAADAERMIGFVDLDGRCRLSAAELSLDVHAERLGSRGREAISQAGRRVENLVLVREAYATFKPLDNVFLDVGKKDIRNGQMLFFSPLDVVQNPLGYSVQGYVSAQGITWRDTYREGSFLVQGTWFGSPGSVELAWIADLANAPDEGVRAWSALQRSNADDRLYLAFGSDIYEDFNPRLVALLGESSQFGIGASGFLNDDLIVNLELAVHDESTIRRVNGDAVSGLALGIFPGASDVLIEPSRRVYTQFAAGFRYTTANRVNVAVEYFFQDQGYSADHWDDYFDLLELGEEYYQASARPEMLGYALLLAGEADDMSRRDMLAGRQYLMGHLAQAPSAVGGLAWESSMIVNLDDLSYALSLNVSSQIQRNLHVYLGGSYLAGSGRSEFGRLGEDGVLYAGVRAIW